MVPSRQLARYAHYETRRMQRTILIVCVKFSKLDHTHTSSVHSHERYLAGSSSYSHRPARGARQIRCAVLMRLPNQCRTSAASGKLFFGV